MTENFIPEEINYRNNQQFLVYLHQGTRPCYLQLTNDELLLLSRVMSNLELFVYLGRIKCSMMCRVGLLLRDKFRKLFNFVIKAMFILGGKSWIFGKCVQHWDGISSVVLHASFFSKPQFSFDYYKNKAAGYRGFQGVSKPEGKYCTVSGKYRHCYSSVIMRREINLGKVFLAISENIFPWKTSTKFLLRKEDHNDFFSSLKKCGLKANVVTWLESTLGS